MAPRIERSASRLAGMLRSRLRPAVAISGFARHRRESPLLPKLWHVISFVGEEKSKNNTACAVPGSQSHCLPITLLEPRSPCNTRPPDCCGLLVEKALFCGSARKKQKGAGRRENSGPKRPVACASRTGHSFRWKRLSASQG